MPTNSWVGEQKFITGSGTPKSAKEILSWKLQFAWNPVLWLIWANCAYNINMCGESYGSIRPWICSELSCAICVSIRKDKQTAFSRYYAKRWILGGYGICRFRFMWLLVPRPMWLLTCDELCNGISTILYISNNPKLRILITPPKEPPLMVWIRGSLSSTLLELLWQLRCW